MTSTDAPSSASALDQWLPYVLVGAGLLAGLLVLLFQPMPWPAANAVVGWSLLAVALGSVYFLVARGGGPGERGPDF